MFAPPLAAVIPDGAPASAFGMVDVLEAMVIGAILVLGIFAFLLVCLTRDRREFWVVRCPTDGHRAVLLVHMATEGHGHRDRVVGCSRFGRGLVPTCGRECLPQAV